MSFPGPRPRKEPSPPFKDPNPDKGKALASLKSGKKIVKLTKIGEALKKKVTNRKVDETLKSYHKMSMSDEGIFLKDAVKEIFNLNDTNTYISQINQVDQDKRNKAKSTYKNIAKTMYDEAQKELSTSKKKTITLYRGVRGEENNLETLVSPINSFSNNISDARKFIKDSMASINKIIKIEVPVDKILATPRMIQRNVPNNMKNRSTYEYLVIVLINDTFS
jgi:hypothetical protein